MKRKHDLLKEKSKTRDAVGQISSWCLLIALHQRFGVGADRMERIAGKAEKLQKEIAAIIDISIHALLAESDSKSAQNSGALLRI